MEHLDTRTDAPSSPESTEEALGRLSLIQALRDFEVANGRVIDLTERLVVTAEDLVTTRQELEAERAECQALRAKVDDLVARHEALRETYERTLERKSVRLGEAIWAAKGSLRRDS